MKIKILLFFLTFLVFEKTYSQIPLQKVHNSLSNSTIQLDSAQKSITLQPNFNWSASNGIYYQSVITQGDMTIEWPKNNQVFQRQNNNKGWVYIKGSCTNLDIDSVKISALVVQGGQSKSKNLFVNSLGIYEGAILLDGGDYNIEVIEYYANGNLKKDPVKKTISRVGVGEVIMVWGHSFMKGDDISQPANDPRSRTIKTVFSFDPPNPYFQDLSLLPIIFEKINTDVGPFNSYSWFFGALADTLVNRLNVPVLIYSAAFGGSRVVQNKQNINNEPFDEPWFPNFEENGFPYRIVEAVSEQYVPKTGLRCVLVHHGSNDSPSPYAAQLQSNYELVINHIRNVEVNHPTLSFFLAFEHSDYTAINTQIQNIVNADVNIFPGIDLRNPATNGPWRANEYPCNGCGHFVGTYGLSKYLEFWKDTIPNSFFSTSTPKEALIDNSLKF